MQLCVENETRPMPRNDLKSKTQPLNPTKPIFVDPIIYSIEFDAKTHRDNITTDDVSIKQQRTDRDEQELLTKRKPQIDGARSSSPTEAQLPPEFPQNKHRCSAREEWRAT
jgi:hypothetical protein